LPKKRSKSKRHKRQFRLLLIIPLIIGPLLIWYVSYGIVNRPVVDYSFGTADQIHPTYQLSALSKYSPGTIDLFNIFVRNRGRTDIAVIITIHAVNALVSATYDGPYNEAASRALVVPASSDYRAVTFYLTLKSQVHFFTLACQGGKLLDYSTFSASVASTFGDIELGSPNFLQYSQGSLSPYEYELVQPS